MKAEDYLDKKIWKMVITLTLEESAIAGSFA
jgi:hypothetical protein